MASRKASRLSAADSFVTLTFTSPGVKISAQDILEGTASFGSTSSTPSKSVANRHVKHATVSNEKSAAADPTLMYTAESPSRDTSPTTSPLENSMSSIKYSTPSTSHSVGHNDELGHASTPKLRLSTQMTAASHEHNQTAHINDQRRSSTASLTDGPTRSSRRVRKLTSKAQALADTNTLPSLQPTTDIEMETEQGMSGDQVELKDDSLQEKVNETNKGGEDQLSQASPIIEVTDTPIESVETTAIRTSPRERKPTARSVESDLGRNTRKRTCSPATTDRAPKIAKTTGAAAKRTSNLRFSTEMAQSSPPVSTKEKSSEADDKSEERNKSRTIEVDQGDQESNEPEKTPVRKASNDISDKVLLEAWCDNPQSSQTDSCEKDLTCLSPSSRLLAFAYAATASFDSDDEADDLDEVVDFDAFYAPLTAGPETYSTWTDIRHKYCQCSQQPVEAKPAQTTAVPPEHSTQTYTDSASKDKVAAREKPAKFSAGKRYVTTRKTRSRISSQEPTISRSEARSTRSTRLSSAPQEASSEDKRLKNQVNVLRQPADTSETISAKPHSNLPSSKNTNTVAQDMNQASTIPIKESAPRKRHKRDARSPYNTSQNLTRENGDSTINDTNGSQPMQFVGQQALNISLDHEDPNGMDTKQGSPNIGPPNAKVTKKVSTKSTNNSTLGNGKGSSTGGSVRLSLQNHGREAVHNSGIPVKVPTPGPPTSIKLRFTTSAK